MDENKKVKKEIVGLLIDNNRKETIKKIIKVLNQIQSIKSRNIKNFKS